MKQGPPCEASSRSVDQKIFRLLWNPKVHYRVLKSPSQDTIVIQLDALHTLISYVFRIRFNIILYLRLDLT
jgi:hypothetical protein